MIQRISKIIKSQTAPTLNIKHYSNLYFTTVMIPKAKEIKTTLSLCIQQKGVIGLPPLSLALSL